MSEFGGIENNTEGSSIQIDLVQDGQIQDLLKIEDQQRSSINSAHNRRKPLMTSQSVASGGVMTSGSRHTAEFPRLSSGTGTRAGVRTKTSCHECVSLTKRLLNSEAERLELALSSAKVKLQSAVKDINNDCGSTSKKNPMRMSDDSNMFESHASLVSNLNSQIENLR